MQVINLGVAVSVIESHQLVYISAMSFVLPCRPGVACSVSGVGEVIMRACLAKECCQRMLNQTLSVDEACSQVMQETTMQVFLLRWF